MDIAKTFAHINGSSQYFYATDANFPESGITGDMSIHCFARVNYASRLAINDLVRKWDAVGQKCYKFGFDADGKLAFTVSIDGTASTTRTSTAVVSAADTWVHVGVTYDASDQSCILYENGVAIADDSAVLANAIFDGTSQFTIGSHEAGETLDGSIAYVALFNNIRTPQEMEDAYTYPRQGLSAEGNIIGYWYFNDLPDATAIHNGQGDSGRDLIPYDAGDTTYRLCGREIGGSALPAQGFDVGLFDETTFDLEAAQITVQDAMISTTVEPRIAFAFKPAGGSLKYYDEYVIDAPNISKGGTGMLSAGSISITLDNTDQTWNIFRSDSDNVGQEAWIGLWFDTAAGRIPGTLWLFKGTVEDMRFVGDTVVLQLQDKFAKALAKVAGQAKGNLPVSIGGTTEAGIKAGDMLWQMLTSRAWGNMDNTEHVGNQDIDYGSFLEWFEACNAKNYLLRARFTGQTLQTALSTLAGLTNSLFWVDNVGRINFTLFDPAVSIAVSDTFTIDKCFDLDIDISSVEKFNKCTVYYGYDFFEDQSWAQYSADRTDADRWVGAVTSEKGDLITKDELRLRVFEHKIIWHVNATGAQNFADDFVELNARVEDRVFAETPLFGFTIMPGAKIRVNHVLLGMTATTGLTGVDDYLIDKVDMDVGTGYARLEGFTPRLWGT